MPTSTYLKSIVCLIFLQAISALGRPKCVELFEYSRDATELTPEIRRAQQNWEPGNFTQPIEHNDNNFHYIIHAGPNLTADGVDPVVAFAKRIRSHDFNQDGFFSTSSISESHTATFSGSGVILEVPKEKIIAATPTDMRSTGSDRLTLSQGLHRFHDIPLPSPKTILSEASGDTGFFNFDLSWTEVLIYGRAHSFQKIKIAGVFVHKDSLDSPILSEARVAVLQSTAKEMGIPFILIPPPKGNFVLKVRMSGTRKPTREQFLTDYGPERIDFFVPEEAVRTIFAKAKAQGLLVRLVDETGGPVSALASDSLFEGGWRDRWKSSAPVVVPDGTSQIDLHFSQGT